MFFVIYFIAVRLQKFWCQLPEDGKIIVPKHVRAVSKIVHINYGIAHLLMLHELFTSS
jgi:hypothetical protein